ncbi:hypothetical protein F2Q69_00053933 [Brassica cretica]|uniref:Uncharacterized protein n=1 Tax=Brassica cretica TaxID=69181 RepID=A0A8S9N545_BRACR|nr:hypothetical protein F2Q69_00053933 [Brassica cretica]
MKRACCITTIIRYFFFGLKEALGFAPSWHLWLRYSSFLVKLSLLHSISKLSLLHSISKLSSPNPSLPFLVEVLASSVSQGMIFLIDWLSHLKLTLSSSLSSPTPLQLSLSLSLALSSQAHTLPLFLSLFKMAKDVSIELEYVYGTELSLRQYRT